MAQTGFTPISLYNTATAAAAPTAGNLVAGELAINTNDGKLFYKDSSGVVQTLATKATTAGTYSSITTSNLTIGTTQLGAGNASIMKNRIINGAMVIDQRNAGASITADNGAFPVDRFRMDCTQTSKGTVQQNAGSVTPPTGFTNYTGFTSTSSYSVTSTDEFTFTQNIEGYNVADLGWGTASAKTVTLSFWAYSSLTGTFGGSFINGSTNRSYPFTYTISAANTWEQKTITVVGDTSGTWLKTNGIGIRIFFSLGVGSTYNGTAGAWAAGDYRSVAGATSVVGTNGATWYITGVQLEVGSSATGFEYVNYQTSLANCQRYFYQATGASGNNYRSIASGVITGATTSDVQAPLPVTMRTVPTSSFSGTIYVYDGSTASTLSSINAVYGGGSYIYLGLISSTGLVTGRGAIMYTINNTNSSVSFSAEL
jgi:hypothetical protein